MIGKLSGIIDTIASDHFILDVQGVGYVVFATRRALMGSGQPGDTLSLLIDTHVREDHIHLYGFTSAAEQQWFRLLTSVQGVGAKVGLSILATCPPDRLQIAIAAQDKAALTQADGVGPKLALRILTELKDKAGQMATSLPASTGKAASISVATKSTIDEDQSSIDQDALSALVNLGYPRSDAWQAVMQARSKAANDASGKAGLDTMIRLALKELSA